MNTSDNLHEATRARAFDWLGKQHFIPVNFGVRWLRQDLIETLEGLPLGGSTSLDYRGVVAVAPHFSLERSVDDLLTLCSLDQSLDAAGKTRWDWPPSERADRNEWIAYDILTVILTRRGAMQVVLIAPGRRHED